ncbi:type 1 glutamine amidotransferase domain-containing protein [Pseudoalteromonas sp. S16_S37]|uniref:type 1 glutamine amidotransferase domain-containing protein n=1 Tax=Pseudoalteromonas sp. S16_S37 TaxID=2720228 RepID=UPI001680DE5F|nr:type 1 glutamine amidotransferase domain-containing protein [Pseudoalteromonas sp. S16_S37]MBD1581992.1 type 1 glutamine amidotransferase domain-containing protein [Pseudoalteromonas sp. S16_S37]
MYKLILPTILIAASFTTYAGDAPNVVMVLSSHGQLNADGELVQPGYEFDELSKAYRVFKANGLDITFASPAGGKPVADEFDKQKPYNQAFLQDTKAVTALNTTYKISELDADNIDAVFVVGGKGPMFDLHQYKPLQTLIANVYEQKGVVSAVCHGPAAFVDVKLSNGQYLVANKRVNGFTNEEEMAFGKKWRPHFAFLLEDKLKERGAQFTQAGLMLNHVQIDGNLITGQNPFSTADTATEVVRALGLKPVALTPNKDDKTMALVAKMMAGEQQAITTYEQNKQDYDTMLVAMSGIYQLQFANQEQTVDSAVKLLELTQKQVNHPMLDLNLAQGYIKQNKQQQAKAVVEAVIKSHPDNQKAKELLLSLQ